MARFHGGLTPIIACIAIAVRVVTASAPAHGHGHGLTAAPHSPTPAPHSPTPAPHGPTHAPHGTTAAAGHGPTHAPHGPTQAPGHGPTHAPHGPTQAPGHGPTHAPHGPTHAPGHGHPVNGHGAGHNSHGGTSAHGGGHGSTGGHGSHGGHGGHHTLAVEDLEDVMLFAGGLLFFSFLFYMTNKKFVRHETVRFTWSWISTTLSIFLAVLFWSDWNFQAIIAVKEQMKARHQPYQRILEVIMVISALIFFFLVAMYIVVAALFGKCCRTRIASVMAFIAVWSHVVGFALINNVAHIQDYFVYRATNTTVDNGHSAPLGSTPVPMKGQVILTSLAVWILCSLGATLLLFVVHRVVMNCIIIPDFEHIDEDMTEEDEGFFVEHPFHAIREHIMEFTSESLALGTSYTLMRVICAGITGFLPAVMATSAKVKTRGEQATLWFIAVIIGFSAAAYVSWRDRVKTMGRTLRLPQVALLYIQQFLTFLTAFTMLQAIRWNMYSAVGARHSLFWHIMTGLFVSFFGLGMDCVFSGPCCSYKFEKEIMTILAILAAFTWELSLDLLLEQVREMGKGTKFWYGEKMVGVINSVLFFMLLPMFVCGIYPMDSFHKAYMKRRKNQLHDSSDDSYDDDPYADIVSDGDDIED